MHTILLNICVRYIGKGKGKNRMNFASLPPCPVILHTVLMSSGPGPELAIDISVWVPQLVEYLPIIQGWTRDQTQDLSQLTDQCSTNLTLEIATFWCNPAFFSILLHVYNIFTVLAWLMNTHPTWRPLLPNNYGYW